MLPSSDEWLALVDRHFGYLRDAGFRAEPVAVDERWRTRAAYMAEDRAFQIDCSLEYNGVDIFIARLVDGQVPPVPMWVTGYTALNRFHLENLVLIRAPDLWPQLRDLRGLTTSSLDEQLGAWAEATTRVADDFIRGDFAAFGPLEEVVRARVRENPPRLTVHVPHDTPESEIQEIIAAHERDLPAGVGIAINKYRAADRADS